MAAQTHSQRLANELSSCRARIETLEANNAEAREGLDALRRSTAAGSRSESALFTTPSSELLVEQQQRQLEVTSAEGSAAAARVTQLEREVSALRQSSAAYIQTLEAAERNLKEMTELLAAGEEARAR
jgi:chromosome segregation ATPase